MYELYIVVKYLIYILRVTILRLCHLQGTFVLYVYPTNLLFYMIVKAIVQV